MCEIGRDTIPFPQGYIAKEKCQKPFSIMGDFSEW